MKNLILGAAKGYSWDILEPFVISCKKNCPSAELVLFVDDISDFTCARLQSAGVLLGSYPENLKRGVPNNTRWKVFADFLKIHGDAYEQIFITDTRDVIFQGDVFEPFKTFKNYLGLAIEKLLIGEDLICNYCWLTDCFGKDMADKLADKKIICDGTVIGTPAEMKIFAEKMSQAVFAVESHVNFRIHDQAVANYLVYNNFLPIENLIEIGMNSGKIFTMAYAENFSVRDNKIFCENGKIPAVVHLYDRYNETLNLVDEIYHDKNFQVDYRFVDMRSVIEQTTCLLFANKIGEAARLFMKKFLVTKDFSDCVKALLRLWEITMRNPLSPASELLELSAQSALNSIKNFGSHLEKICIILKRAQECRHPVDPELENALIKSFFKIAEQKLAENESEQFVYCLEIILSIKRKTT